MPRFAEKLPGDRSLGWIEINRGKGYQDAHREPCSQTLCGISGDMPLFRKRLEEWYGFVYTFLFTSALLRAAAEDRADWAGQATQARESVSDRESASGWASAEVPARLRIVRRPIGRLASVPLRIQSFPQRLVQWPLPKVPVGLLVSSWVPRTFRF